MSSEDQIICEICKKPIESREELTVAMAFSKELKPFHTECYSQALRVPISKSGFWKYGFVVNRGLWPLVSEYASYALFILFSFVFLKVQANTVDYYPPDWVPGIILLNTLLLPIVFIPPYLLWKNLIKRRKDVSWKLYESRLPEHLSGTGQTQCDVCKQPILSRNDLLILIARGYRYVPVHPRCFSELLKKPRIPCLKIHHRARWERYSSLIPVILLVALFVVPLTIKPDYSVEFDRIAATLAWITLIWFAFGLYRTFKREAERSWREYESKLPER